MTEMVLYKTTVVRIRFKENAVLLCHPHGGSGRESAGMARLVRETRASL
jgi:hypothetical protein